MNNSSTRATKPEFSRRHALGFAIAFWGMFMMSSLGRAAEPAIEYGQPVPFRAGVALSFTDFRLTYIGDRRVASPQFAPGFLYRDFRLETAHQVSQISWTSGTGDIAPLSFAVAGRQYRLELQFSESLGRLAPDTLVVSPAPERR